jgi:hypothetical protein
MEAGWRSWSFIAGAYRLRDEDVVSLPCPLGLKNGAKRFRKDLGFNSFTKKELSVAYQAGLG